MQRLDKRRGATKVSSETLVAGYDLKRGSTATYGVRKSSASIACAAVAIGHQHQIPLGRVACEGAEIAYWRCVSYLCWCCAQRRRLKRWALPDSTPRMCIGDAAVEHRHFDVSTGETGSLDSGGASVGHGFEQMIQASGAAQRISGRSVVTAETPRAAKWVNSSTVLTTHA